MLRFLKLLKGNPSLVSRQRYGAHFRNKDPFVKQLKAVGLNKADIFNSDYDRLVGKGKAQPTAEDIQTEIDKLLRVTAKIARVANKVIAHHDRQKPKRLPTFADIGVAIGSLETLVIKYKVLLEATSTSMWVSYQYDWKAIFRVAWIS